MIRSTIFWFEKMASGSSKFESLQFIEGLLSSKFLKKKVGSIFRLETIILIGLFIDKKLNIGHSLSPISVGLLRVYVFIWPKSYLLSKTPNLRIRMNILRLGRVFTSAQVIRNGRDAQNFIYQRWEVFSVFVVICVLVNRRHYKSLFAQIVVLTVIDVSTKILNQLKIVGKSNSQISVSWESIKCQIPE